VRGSAERWKESVSLPRGGSPGQPYQYGDVYLGMVVGGDPTSFLRQSFLEVVFTPSSSGPNTTVTWSISAAVWGLHNSTAGGNCTASMTLVWNWSLWCIDNMLSSGGRLGPSGLPGGTWYNVTFDGVTGGSTGMWVWANDSTNSSGNFAFRLNATTTRGFAYEPFFNASCNDICFLNWSGAYGLGSGWDPCPIAPSGFAACDTYNQTVWTGSPPVQFGIPQYWVNASAGYSGEYQYFAPMSLSAQCSSSTIVPVASCNNYNAFGGTGFYPFYTWNGSLLNFGDQYPWTVNDLGGYYTEYIQTGAIQHDLVPLFLEKVTNDSRGGYLRPNTALNISAKVSDLGLVRSVVLAYTLNSGAPFTLPMTRLSGTAQRGVYNATVPAGVNGWINYTVTATNNASMTAATNTLTVYRGPLPVFGITVTTHPASCTNATVNGTQVVNGTIVRLNPGTYPISTTSCYSYRFHQWTTSPGLRVTAAGNISTNLTVSRAGTILANWTYVRPNVTVAFQTVPSACGTVVIDGTTINAGSVASVPYGLPATVSQPTGCAMESFAGWTFVGNFTLVGTNLLPGGNGTLAAHFIAPSSGSTLTFRTLPASCGGVLYRGVGYTDLTTLTVNSTPYPVAPAPCAHYGFLSFSTSGGATISNGNLTVTSAGTVTEQNYHLTEVVIQTVPAFCTMTFDGTRYGNGTVLVLQNNSTHVVSQNSCPGYYPFSITVTPGLSLFGDVLTVNSSGTVLGNWLSGSGSTQFLEFQTDPGNCGTISFGGGVWYNTNNTNVGQNATGPISANACANYGFVRWVTSPGVTVAHGFAYVNSSGSIEAVFRPIANIAIETTPSACGSVILNGVTYTSNGSAVLTEDFPYPVTPVPCDHFSFVGWSDTIGATVVNGTLYLATDAILTANFLPTPYNVSVRIDPGKCGSVYLGGVSETNGTNVTLSFGTYPLRAAPCLGNRLVGYNTTGGLTIVGSTVTVGANGTLTALYRPVPPSVVLGIPTSSFAGDVVSLTATVAVLVPPYTYNFSWTFGDGSTAVTPANFTSHTYAHPGTYHVSVVVHDPYARNASANQTIQVVPPSGASGFAIPVSTLAILALFAFAIVALLAVAYWRRRPPPAATTEEGGVPEAGEASDALYLPAGADRTGSPRSPSEDQA
jgi:hypothetical protein